MIECQKCGYLNPDGTQFCQNPASCDAFVGYGKKVEPLPGGVSVVISPTMVSVAPGAQATAEVRVRNKSNIVDQYEISITGAPSSWSVAEPSVVPLFPDKEGVATLRYNPPRSSDVTAGRKLAVITVQSKASPQVSSRQEAAIEVGAFAEAALSIAPRTARGGDAAAYRVLVQNKGNVPLSISLEASDPDELLTFDVDRPSLTLTPGQTATVQLTARPRATFFDGAPQPHPFKVQLQADGVPTTVADATMLQEAVPRPVPRKFPLVPVLLGLLLLTLITGAVFERDPLIGVLTGSKASPGPAAPNTGPSSAAATTSATPTASPTPTPTPAPVLVAVPNVVCASAADAQKSVQNAGLKFVGTLAPNRNVPKFAVVSEAPAAGTQAAQGSEVTVTISTGPPAGGVAGINTCGRIIIGTLPPGILLRPLTSPSP